MRIATLVLAVLALASAAACTPSSPPTVTPGSVLPQATGARVVDIPIGTVPAGVPGATPQPLSIERLLPFREEGGLFSMSMPDGWAATRQPPAKSGTDVRVGYVFQPLVGSGLITVTQFDNGTPPASLGQTINSVLKLTGWTNQPGYRELGRENVLGREGSAMRVEIMYNRSNGVPMHSLALFQVDGTTFSMVNMAVESSNWRDNEGMARDILASYRVPAEAVPTP